MAPNRALGRGLDQVLADVIGDRRSIPVNRIEPNPEQPRQKYEPDEEAALTASIQQHGILQPLLVTPAPTQPGLFLLVAGERRWRAARRAGLHEVPVKVIAANAKQRMELALVENVQRRDLGSMERAAAYKTLLEEFGMTQAQIAEVVGVSRSTVANTVRLLELGTGTQDAISSGRITGGHGLALLAQADPGARHRLLQRILSEGLSVREVERAARAPSARRSKQPPAVVDVELQSVAERLQRRLAARVRITGTRERGRIQIEYRGGDELNTLLDELLPE